jgi:hypothetical protein
VRRSSWGPCEELLFADSGVVVGSVDIVHCLWVGNVEEESAGGEVLRFGDAGLA